MCKVLIITSCKFSGNLQKLECNKNCNNKNYKKIIAKTAQKINKNNNKYCVCTIRYVTLHRNHNYRISSKRHRGYYLFQLYRNAATIRGRLLFEVQTPWLLFITALPQCGDYSRAATIRSTDTVVTIYYSSTAMRRLFEGGYYSKYRHRGYYLFQLYRNAATIRGRLLFEEIRYCKRN